MKNILFSLVGLALIVGVVGCKESEGREPSPTVDGPAIHFADTDNNSRIDLGMEQTTFNVAVYRTNASSESVTVPLSFTDESELFSAPTSVTFASGVEKVEIPVTFDPADLELGTFYPISFAITDNTKTTLYGPSQVTINAGQPLIWETWASGVLTSEFFEFEHEMNLQKAKGVNRFRFAAPFVTGFPFNFTWDVDEKATSITPLGTGMTIGGVPVIRQATGEPYDDTSSIYVLTDPDGTETFYDPETQVLTISSYYYVFVDETMGGVGGFGWFYDYFEITSFAQGNPWE